MPPHPSPSICARCSHRVQWHRGFATTASRAAVPPESPSFVHVPEPVQAPTYDAPKPLKGVLPIPRNIFSKHSEYRATSEYKESTTPEPKKLSEATGPDGARLRYNQRMSAIRRQTLREGITEIWDRKQRSEDQMSKKSGLKQVPYRKAGTLPDPLDEVLTNPTVHPTAKLMMWTRNAPGPKAKGVNNHYKKKQDQLSRIRKEHLHNLYVHARNFIVNEEQLNEEIEKVFGTDDDPIMFNGIHNSVWGLGQKPLTAEQMLSYEQRGAQGLVDDGMRDRMRKIAEALTGGKMPPNEEARDFGNF